MFYKHLLLYIAVIFAVFHIFGIDPVCKLFLNKIYTGIAITSDISFSTRALSPSGPDDLLINKASSFFFTISRLISISLITGMFFKLSSGRRSSGSIVKTEEKKLPKTLAFASSESVNVVLLSSVYKSAIDVFVFDFDLT